MDITYFVRYNIVIIHVLSLLRNKDNLIRNQIFDPGKMGKVNRREKQLIDKFTFQLKTWLPINVVQELSEKITNEKYRIIYF